MVSKNQKYVTLGGVILFFILTIIIVMSVFKSASPKSLDDLVKGVDVTSSELVKGSISLGNASLYDELPEINKYPLAIESVDKDINIEVFTSGEKGGADNDSWLINVAENFNNSNITQSDGKTVGVSVRSVSSGLGADYIIANKYIPDLYTPSNKLFGEYARANGAKIEILSDKLVGNTAGILINKSSSYKSFEDIVSAVQSGSINLGYTNPQTSASGLNFLITLLKSVDSTDIASNTAAEAFSNFNKNIPYVAYTTQQMSTSASNGTLDGMIMEYQTYINSKDLTSTYNFIPFGMRHDNPLYITSTGEKHKEAVNLFKDFCLSDDMQKIATEYGFNANEDYKSGVDASGTEICKALEVYKKNKDSGTDIMAVFVADCSGSMTGDPLNQLKTSLSNASNYINANNYIGLVSYDSDVVIRLPIAKFDMNQHSYFEGAVNSLSAGGATSTYEALCVATNMIKEAKVDNPNSKAVIFLLSDGEANGDYSLNTVKEALKLEEIPIYTICYTENGDPNAMKAISDINEAATINADSDDVVYKIKSLFNSQL